MVTLDNFANKDNLEFYERMPVGTLQDKFLEKSGLKGTPDVALLKSYWEKTDSILEIGAGEGRVIDGLLIRRYLGEITALERSSSLCNHLKQKYSKLTNVKILEADLLSIEIPKRDIGLWLWSGILEFSPKEQKKAIHRLSRCVEVLCFDTPKLGEKTNATLEKGNRLSMKQDWGDAYGYIPSLDEIKFYAKGSKFSLRYNFDLFTEAGRIRTFYIFEK